MNHQAELLVNLQKIDKEIENHKKRKEIIPLQIEDLKRQIQKLHEEIDSLKTLLVETEKQVKKIELDIKSKEEEILGYQAMEHMVKSNEEYRALMEQIEKAKKEKDTLEEKEIELLYKIDELKKQIESKREENAQREKEIREKIREIEDEFTHIDDKLQILMAKREDYAKKIESGLYNQYEKIRRIKGDAVAYVIDGSCSGCSAVLPLQLVITLKSTGEIGRCENCGRLLVYVPEKDVQE